MKKKSSNKDLRKANSAKKDEFYTQLVDIENEMKYYKKAFRDKVVYCNCDDPYESNFFKYFASNFNALGLKKLITTSYSGSPIVGGQLPLFEVVGSKGKQPFKIEITEVPDIDKDGAINLDDVKYLLKHDKNTATPLCGSGDFRSDECIELLKQSDIVITNPPFSLFREYVAQLVENNKRFLILGNMNAITYKEIFKLIKENKLWSGYGFNMSMVYRTPYSNNLEANKKFVAGKGYNPNEGYVKVPAVNWYTNLEVEKHKQDITLYKKYTPKEYQKYDNYNAINVDRVSDIPMDYKGVMGVPITFLDKYNPDQFEIIWIADRQNSEGIRTKTYTIEDTKNYNDLNRGPVVNVNGELKVVYMRILIKNKKPLK
ncbi:MAG: adenine-specific methyltransferase EcoRI family protein [Candidatus Vogelbacteria bacterium]